jgi:holo-[acyl-carrier protein] synthase
MGQAQIGIDIIEIERIEETISRWGERFLKRIYTQNEIELCGGKVSSLAARFAGKEAVMKALNSGQDNIIWREIEILNEPGGKPKVLLSGTALQLLVSLGLKDLEISLSHSRGNAVALVIGIRER